MISYSETLGQTLGRLLKWTLALWFGLLVLALLLVGIGVALLSVLWSLLRGKKPAMLTVFQALRRASRPLGRAGRQAPVADAADIVDVQAHEVRPGSSHGTQ